MEEVAPLRTEFSSDYYTLYKEISISKIAKLIERTNYLLDIKQVFTYLIKNKEIETLLNLLELPYQFYIDEAIYFLWLFCVYKSTSRNRYIISITSKMNIQKLKEYLKVDDNALSYPRKLFMVIT